jgi:hypothetical protein
MTVDRAVHQRSEARERLAAAKDAAWFRRRRVLSIFLAFVGFALVLGSRLALPGAKMSWMSIDPQDHRDAGVPNGATAAVDWSLTQVILFPALRKLRIIGVGEKWLKSKYAARMMSWTSSERRAQFDYAHRYYQQQRPILMEAAKEFALDDYWNHMGDVTMGMTWEGLCELRVRGMKAQLDLNGREDFKVEKDKCDMVAWIQRTGFSTPEPLGTWYDSPTHALHELTSMVDRGNVSWPIFLKMCHLTQGVEDSVRRLKSAEWVRTHREDLARYIEEKWMHQADDANRIFYREANALTDVIKPGLMLQAAFPVSMEFKVQVLWGRAYLAYAIEAEGIVLRDGSFEQGARENLFAVASPLPVKDIPDLAWIEREGHLPHVWRLAERVAAAMSIEQVRVDIFVSKGSPEEPSLNEISLTSGMQSHFHTEFLNELWAEPFVRNAFKSTSNTEPIHLRGPASNVREASQSEPSPTMA